MTVETRNPFDESLQEKEEDSEEVTKGQPEFELTENNCKRIRSGGRNAFVCVTCRFQKDQHKLALQNVCKGVGKNYEDWEE